VCVVFSHCNKKEFVLVVAVVVVAVVVAVVVVVFIAPPRVQWREQKNYIFQEN